MAQKSLSIKQNMLWNSLGSLTNLGCQWLITVLVVRLSSGFDAAGALSLAMAIGNIFAPIAQYKIRSYQVSDIHKEVSAGEYVGFRIFTIAAALVISLVYTLATLDISMILPVLLYLLYKSVEVFIDVLHGVDQQHLRMDYCGKSLATRGICSLIAFSAVLKLTNDLNLAILSMALVTLPVALFDWRAASQFDTLKPQFSAAQFKRLLIACLPAAIGTAFCSAVVTVSRQSLSGLLGADILGLYASVCTPVVIVQAGANYIYTPLLGVFAQAYEDRDFKRYFSLLARVSAALVGLLALGIVAFALLGTPFLNIVFGAEVAQNAYLMYAALVSVILCAYATFLGDQLIAVRKMWSIVAGNGLSLAIVALLSGPFIERFGMNGTSIIISIAFFAGSALMLALLCKKVASTQAEQQSRG